MNREQAAVVDSTPPKGTRKALVAKHGAAGALAKGRAPKRAKAAAEPKHRKQATGTKSAQVLALLHRKGGATVQDIMAATDWLPHTVRGFLAGTVRKKLGLTVTSTKADGGKRTYVIGV